MSESSDESNLRPLEKFEESPYYSSDIPTDDEVLSPQIPKTGKKQKVSKIKGN